MGEVRALVVGALQTNCYVLQSEAESLIVDPGDEGGRIVRFLKDIQARPTRVLATHAHFDHILGVDVVRREFGIPFLIHRDDLPLLESMQSRVRQLMGIQVPPPPEVDDFLEEGAILEFGRETVRVIHTPGHSPGSISLSGDGYVLTGDALFNQSIGRTDLPGGDLKTLVDSITKKLFTLDEGTIVYPGHGPETVIRDEKLANPFVGKVARAVR